MNSSRTLLLVLSASIWLLYSLAPASAVTLSVGSGVVDLRRGNTVTIDVMVDDPTAIAGAALTVAYDTQALELVSVTSDFFAPLAEQFEALPGAGKRFVADDGKSYVPITNKNGTTNVPVEDTINGSHYTQPLLLGQENGQGRMLTGARVLPGEAANPVLFTLTFEVSSPAEADYEITLAPSWLSDSAAGYPSEGEAAPMLIGALAPVPGADPADPAYLQVPVEQINSGTISVVGSTKLAIMDKPGSELVVEAGANSQVFSVTGGDDSSYTWAVTDSHGTPIDRATGATYAFSVPTSGHFAGVYTVKVTDNQGFSDSFTVRVPIRITPANLAFTETKLDGSENPQTFTVTGAEGDYTWEILESATATGPAADPEQYGAWLKSSPVLTDNTNTLKPAETEVVKSFYIRVSVDNDPELTGANGLSSRIAGPFTLVPVAEFTVSLSDQMGPVNGALLKPGELTVREKSTNQQQDLTAADGKVSFLLPDNDGTFAYEVRDLRMPAVYLGQSVSSSANAVAITLEKAGPDLISGVVADVEGLAVAGARVYAYQPEAALDKYETTSTAEGVYAIALPPGAPLAGWTVVASHPDYLEQRQQDRAAGAVNFVGEYALYAATVITNVSATVVDNTIRIDITASPAITAVSEVAIVLNSGKGQLSAPELTDNIEAGATLTLFYSQLKTFSLTVAVDTSEDHDPNSGYEATQQLVFNARQLLKSVSHRRMGKAGGSASLRANGQSVAVVVPEGGVTVDETTLVIEQFVREQAGHQSYAYEITEYDQEGHKLTDEQINRLEITMPLDLSVVKQGDLKKGKAFIRHSHDIAALESGSGPAVPTTDILLENYIGADGQSGSVTFQVGSLSAFEVALTDAAAPPAPADPAASASGGSGGGGGCFISTAADARLLEIYALVLQRLQEVYLLIVNW